MKRRLKWLLVIIIVLAVLVALTPFYLGNVVKTAVNGIGPKVLGVPVKLDKVKVNLFRGEVNLEGFRVGNPAGFNTANLMTMNSFKLSLDPGSLMNDTIVVRSLQIDSPEIFYEQQLTANNFATFIKNLTPDDKDKPKTKPEPIEPKEKTKPEKKIVIEDFQLLNAKLNVSLPGMEDKTLPLPLPNLVLVDIGKESGGASPVEVIKELTTGLLDSIIAAVSGSANLLGDGANFLKQGLKQGAATLGDAQADLEDMAKDAGEKIKDTADKGLQAASEALTDAGQTLKDGVKDGAGKILGGLKKLIPAEESPSE